MTKQATKETPGPRRAARTPGVGRAPAVAPAQPQAGVGAGWTGGLSAPGDLLALQRLAGNATVQRLLRDQADGGGDAPRPVGAEGGALPPALAGRIDRLRGAGRSVDGALSRRVGDALGADLSGVRVHTDGEADALNRSLTARAFTAGNDIFFSHGAYRPGSPGGDRLLAHELTHVVQQGGGHVRRSAASMTVGRADDPQEVEADRVVDEILRPDGAAAGGPPIALQAGDPGTAARTIRRAVGYEFETNMKVEKANTGIKGVFQAYRPMRKMELIQAYNEGMRMEADENSTLGSTIEFVIDPPVAETDEDRLEQVLGRLSVVASQLDLAVANTPVTLDTLTGNQAHANVRVTAQGPLTANPQVTGGVSLDKIITMLSEIGGGSANAPAGHQHAASELEQMSPQGPGQAAERGASTLGTAGFKALVAFASSYIKFGAKQTPTYPPLNYAKLLSNSVLLRTDLGSIFLKLPPDEREEYENFPDHFVKIVMDAANPPAPSPDLPVIERGVRKSYTPGAKGYNQLVDNAATRVTRREWLTAITTGVDLLSSHHMPDLKKYLEGLGALGPTTDLVGNTGAPAQPIGPKDRGSGIVMEFRNMRKNVAWTKWQSLAAEIFDYIVNLNAR